MGTEHEKLAYNLADNTRVGYDKIQPLLEGLCQRYGWAPVMEGDNIIGAELDGQSVSLEPGGQFELSGAPLNTVHETNAEVNTHLVQARTPRHVHACTCSVLPLPAVSSEGTSVHMQHMHPMGSVGVLGRQASKLNSQTCVVQAKAIAAELGIGFLAVGFDPKWRVEDVPIMPKGRYRLQALFHSLNPPHKCISKQGTERGWLHGPGSCGSTCQSGGHWGTI